MSSKFETYLTHNAFSMRKFQVSGGAYLVSSPTVLMRDKNVGWCDYKKEQQKINCDNGNHKGKQFGSISYSNFVTFQEK